MPKMSVFHPWTYDENLFNYKHEFKGDGAVGHEGKVEKDFEKSIYKDKKGDAYFKKKVNMY